MSARLVLFFVSMSIPRIQQLIAAPLLPSENGHHVEQEAAIFQQSSGYDNIWAPEMFEGDIAGVDLTKARQSNWHFSPESYPRNAVLHLKDRWPKGKVPYAISSRFSQNETDLILRSIDEINNVTDGINLVPRNNENNHVYIVRGGPKTGCWSYVGLIGGRQDLNLEVPVKYGDAHCMFKGIIEHELLHAIGLWHEQSRTDRDDHVEINWDNIAGNQRHNFDNYAEEYITAFGQPYDYNSLMHYGKYDFAIDRKLWTIRPLPPNQDVPIGQRKGLSPIDITKLNFMYPKESENPPNTGQ